MLQLDRITLREIRLRLREPFRISSGVAYTVGFEHKTVVADGTPATYTLRVTHIYRREDGQWRIVHRHGDSLESRSPSDVVDALSRSSGTAQNAAATGSN